MSLFCLGEIALLLNPVQAYEQQVEVLSGELALSISAEGKKAVAVVDFSDLQGDITELGRFLAEEFSSALANSDLQFEIIDRTHLRTVLEEHKLSTRGLIDPSSVRELGELAGVEALVTGTITPLGDTVRIAAKILDVNTARVIGSVRGNIAKTQPIAELLKVGLAEGTSASGASGNSSSESNRSRRSSTTPFDSSKFRVDFGSLKSLDGGKRLLAPLVIENKTDKLLHVWVEQATIVAINEFGEPSYAHRTHGLVGRSKFGSEFTIVNPMARHRASVELMGRSNLAVIDGREFSLNMDFYVKSAGRESRVSVAVSGLEIVSKDLE
ncbi:MAG: FlgO family outer membrane protein [Acidobacteriota bacterium]